MNAAQIETLAQQWALLKDGDTSIDDKVDDAVVLMNFTKPAETQWAFILSAIQHAQTNDAFAALAAGPVEHLLGWHGDDYIDRVEAEAARSQKFAHMLTFAWRYMMNDEVWARVQALQADAQSAGNTPGAPEP